MHEKETIEAIAKSLFEAIKREGGHICVHQEDWGSMKTAMENLTLELERSNKSNDEILKELITAKNEQAQKIAKLENTLTVIWLLTGLAALVWTAGKLKIIS